MSIKTRLCLMSGAVMLGACAIAPEPERTDILEQALPTVTTPDTWATAALSGEVTDGWLQTFDDPVLERLVAEALQNSLELRGAATRVERARAEALAAGASLRPVVAAAGGATAQSNGQARFENRGAGLGVSWEVDVWGRIRSGAAGAEQGMRASQADFEFARQSLAGAVAKGWFLATETRAGIDSLESELAARDEMLRITEARFEVGRSSMEDVHLSRAAIAGTNERLVAARNAHQQSLRALDLLLGRYPSAELAAARSFGPMPASVPTGIPSEILERRPDLMAAESRVRAAFRATETARLARMPSFSLTGGIGVAAPGESFFSVGGNFLASIIDGGRTQAQVQIATAEQEAALVAYGQTALRAYRDVEDSLDAERALAQREAQVTIQLHELRQAERLRSVEVEVGKADTLSVLQLQAQVYTTEALLLTLQQAQRSERVNMHLALGGGFE